jgi:hypothetical protein
MVGVLVDRLTTLLCNTFFLSQREKHCKSSDLFTRILNIEMSRSHSIVFVEVM